MTDARQIAADTDYGGPRRCNSLSCVTCLSGARCPGETGRRKCKFPDFASVV